MWAVGTEGSWALVFLNPGSGQPLKLAQGFSLGTADPEWEGGVASLALGGTLPISGALTSQGDDRLGSVSRGLWEPQAG